MNFLKRFLFLTFVSSLAAAQPPAHRCAVSPFETALGQPALALQERLCKADECGDVTNAELRAYDACSIVDGQKAINQASGLSGLMDDVAEGMVFQDLARNSHQQAVCRNEFLLRYETKSDQRTRLNAAAETAFNAVKNDLTALIAYGEKLESDLRHDEAVRLAARISWDSGEHERRKKEVEDAKLAISKEILAVPMGYDADVSKALLKMGANGKFDLDLFQKAMSKARIKYAEADQFYSSKFMPLENGKGTYCLWLEWRNRAGRSGQLRHYMESFPATTPEQKGFKDKLTCRLTRTYECGQEVLKNTTAVTAFAAGLIPPVRAAETIGAIAAATRAAVLATTAVRGVAALDAAFSSQLLYDECLGFKLISGERKTCDPEQEFARTVEGVQLSSCLLGLGASAMGILQAARAFKEGATVLGLTSALKPSEFEEALAQAKSVASLNGREAAAKIGLVGKYAKTPEERVKLAEAALGRPLTSNEKAALENAHNVGADREGAGFGTYERPELKEKRQFLKEAGSDEEADKLMRLGLAGAERKFSFGEVVFLAQKDGSIAKGRVLKVSDGNVRVELDQPYGKAQVDIGLSELSRTTGLVRSRAFSVGEQVYVPRADGSFTLGKIVGIDPRDGDTMVEIRTAGGSTTKYVNPESLKKAPQPNDDALNAQDGARAYQRASGASPGPMSARPVQTSDRLVRVIQQGAIVAKRGTDQKARLEAARRILQLSPYEKDAASIQRAWKAAVREYHPDRFSSPSAKETAAKASAAFNNARDVLLDAAKVDN